MEAYTCSIGSQTESPASWMQVALEKLFLSWSGRESEGLRVTALRTKRFSVLLFSLAFPLLFFFISKISFFKKVSD